MMLMILNYVAIYFILTDGFGYIPTQDVHKIDMSCGLPGVVVGITMDSRVNPTKAYWPDPGFPNLFHCVVDISQRVVGLQQGEYELATTDMGELEDPLPFIIDPHTSVKFLRVNGTGTLPKKPGTIRIQGQ